MDKIRLKELLAQYFDHTINPADCEELLAYLSANRDVAESSGVFDELLLNRNDGPAFHSQNADKVFDRIKTSPEFTRKSNTSGKLPQRLYQQAWFRVAAIVVVVFSIGMLFYSNNQTLRQVGFSLAGNNASESLSSVSVLKLSDGKVIELDSVKNGLIMIANGAKISKSKEGQLVYDISSGSDNNQSVFHTLSTAKGKEYQVNLPDGTRVWLNSSSVLTFPTRFSGADRVVQLNGEAYFEVAKNKSMPFKVNAHGTTVKVLGTHFNIMAYNDEDAVTTTLLEGAVKVGVADSELAIKPGQQAIVKRAGNNSILVSEVNTADAMAWKNGYFKFQDEDIKSIMKKVCRWYDVEVEYQGDVDDQKFGGTFYRAKSLVELLNYLEKLGTVKFKITGRRIIVMA